jgi:hypothetical protein
MSGGRNPGAVSEFRPKRAGRTKNRMPCQSTPPVSIFVIEVDQHVIPRFSEAAGDGTPNSASVARRPRPTTFPLPFPLPIFGELVRKNPFPPWKSRASTTNAGSHRNLWNLH